MEKLTPCILILFVYQDCVIMFFVVKNDLLLKLQYACQVQTGVEEDGELKTLRILGRMVQRINVAGNLGF